MDTVEELNSTYFYAGRSNLTASQLLFMIFCENTANQLGVQDFGAIVSIVAGLNVLPTRTKPRGAIEGTQLPSVIGGYPPSTLKIKMVAKISAFTGRAIPVVGWIILASDVSQIAYRTVRDYNRIARGSDKIW
ncbi:TPA: hypothetical protein H2S92_003144 [Salmonella enterica]|nr:hypothetical protein [Salmonella enterica]